MDFFIILWKLTAREQRPLSTWVNFEQQMANSLLDIDKMINISPIIRNTLIHQWQIQFGWGDLRPHDMFIWILPLRLRSNRLA